MGQPVSPQPPDTAPPPPLLLPRVPAAMLSLAALHRLRQQALAQRLAAALRRLWSTVVPAAAQASWDRQAAAQAVAAVTAVQAEAARGAQDYVATAVSLWGAASDPAGTVLSSALSGVAADGRALDSLLSYPASQVDAFLAQGMDPTAALAVGQRHLERIAVTEIQDTARVATGVATVNDRAVRGYIRMLTPPSCARCVILAGTFYPANAGFERHPQCDCVHIPAVEHLPDLATDPKRYFAALSETDQNATFTAAGARAIRDGADLGQVVNARRGMSKAADGRLATREGSSKRGFAGQRLGRGAVRLMPEQIYRDAGGSRDEALRLLRLHGYII